MLIHESGEEKRIHGRVRRHERDADGRAELTLTLEAPLPEGAPEHPRRWRLAPISTFKWSKDNGAFAAKVLSIEADALQLTLPNLTERSEAVSAGDHLEVVDEEATLRLLPGPLCKIAQAELDDDEAALRVTLTHPATDPLGREPEARLDRRPLVRRWGRRRASDRSRWSGQGSRVRSPASGRRRSGAVRARILSRGRSVDLPCAWRSPGLADNGGR